MADDNQTDLDSSAAEEPVSARRAHRSTTRAAGENGEPAVLNPRFASGPIRPVSISHSLSNAVDPFDPATAALEPLEGGGLKLEALAHGFRRRWPEAITLGLLCALCISLGTWFLLEPKYTAYGQLQIANQSPSILPDSGSERQTSLDLYTRLQKELIRSRFVLNAALREPDAAKLQVIKDQLDPVAWLATKITVDLPGNAELVRVSMAGEDGKQLATLVNAVIDAYMREVVGKEAEERVQRIATLEKMYLETQESVRRRRGSLKRLAETLGSGDAQALTLKQQIALQQFGELRRELTRVQFELRWKTLERAAAEARLKGTEQFEILPAQLDQLVAANAEILALQGYVARAEADVTHIESVAKQESVKSPYRRALDEARKDLAAATERVTAGVKSRLQSQLTVDAQGELARLQSSLELLTAQEQALSKDVAELSSKADDIGKSSIDVEMERAEITQLEQIARRLGSELETLKLQANAPLRVRVLERAEVPRFKDTGKQLSGTIALSLLGLMVPIVGLSWWDARKQRVSSIDEVTRMAGMQVIGSLPLLPRPTRPRFGQASPKVTRTLLALRESIDGVRTMLQHQNRRDSTQVIMVTSAIGGEGKTTLATLLGISFARARCRTLLIDCDLRRPSAHKLFSLPLQPGVCDVLRQEATIEEAVRPTSTDSLWFMPAGACDDESLAALAQDAMGGLIGEMRDRFDFIIVDCSPILPVVDGLLVGRHVDAAVLSVLRDVSEAARIQSAYRRLTALGVNVLGTIVAGAKNEVYSGNSYQIEIGSPVNNRAG